jgi:TonB family protein
MQRAGHGPAKVGRYFLLDPVAEGRTGVVHWACLRREAKPDKLLAIKCVSPELSRDRGFAERFTEVMTRATRVEHPAHCAIEDVDQTEDGSLYVAMSLVVGKDLGRVTARLGERGEVLPPQLAAYIGSQIADALAAAHALSRGDGPWPLYHGELSPTDILIGYDGRVQLTGLGSAALQAAAPAALARHAYQAPELALGAACSPAADVFSLGACLYEALAGSPARSDGRSSGARRPDSHIRQLIPRSLDQIVSRALAEQPSARWPSAAALAQALRQWCAGHPSPGSAPLLSSFMLGLFENERTEDERRLRASLATLPEPPNSATVASPSPNTESRTGYAKLVRASQRPAADPITARPVAPRASALPPHPPSAPLPRGALKHDWIDPSERTPPRELLMQKLAAEMVDQGQQDLEPGAAELDAAAPLIDVDLAQDTPSVDFSDGGWSDDTPAEAWGGPADGSNAAVEAPKSRPSQPIPVKRTAPPVKAPAPRLPVAPPPALPSQRQVRRSAAPGFEALQPQPPWRALQSALRSQRMLVSAVVGALLVLLAGLLLLKRTNSELGILDVQSHPAGAEVFIGGQRIGTTPLQQSAVRSGSVRIELRTPGFEPLQYSLELKAGEHVHLEADLVRHTEPVVSRAPVDAADEAVAASVREGQTSQAARERSASQASERSAARRHQSASAREATRPSQLKVTPASSEPAVDQGTPATAPEREVAVPTTPAPAAVPSSQATVRSDTASPVASAAMPAAAAPRAPRAPQGETRAAVLVTRVTPRFPTRAKRMEITQGFVTLEFTIDRSGAVTNAVVVDAKPVGVFDGNALQAIQKWKYRPKLENGKPVESRQRFKFTFTE